MSYCPDCNQKYFCPCPTCVERFKSEPDFKPWERLNITNGTWDEKCPGCGIVKDTHDWESLFVEQFNKINNELGAINFDPTN